MKQSKYKISNNLYRCECGKEFNNYQSLNAHFSHCLIHKKMTGQEPKLKNRRVCGFESFDKNKLKEVSKKGANTIKQKYKNGELCGSFTGKKHSESTKEKIREARFKYLSDGKQHGAFDKSKKTYLEKWFDEFLIENQLYNIYNIKYNYSVYPYFLDYAFIDLMLDVELDGSFHYKYEKNILHDNKRNTILENNGWKIFRISIDEINKDCKKVELEFLKYLKEFNITSKSRYYNL